MARRRKKALTHSIYYDPRNLRRRYIVACSPATHVVKLTREAMDVLQSKQGTTVGCTNSNCAARVGEAVFGHPVFLAEFTKTSAYIVDRLDRYGMPKHCIWYKHNDGETIDLNDHIVSRTELLKRINLGKAVVLRPPANRVGQKPSAPHAQAPRHAQTARRNPVAHGAIRRAKEAGLFVPQNG